MVIVHDIGVSSPCKAAHGRRVSLETRARLSADLDAAINVEDGSGYPGVGHEEQCGTGDVIGDGFVVAPELGVQVGTGGRRWEVMDGADRSRAGAEHEVIEPADPGEQLAY